ncbi:hypothetical protein WM40_22680 [Robbsia andropogonis]|uniref:Uncharacterized protein n=1 Tax=Robbsia andropogonis TaxID=28092 RepID=A0A0F5JUM8_9BURK|nr:hypothetical protein [Robbsia andropogonis]KKB61548.1 hypothetical protein WM40_22680 [Robbsia andropogonis]
MTQPLTAAGQRTLLAIIQDVMLDLGLPLPVSVIGNSDNTVRQLLVFANRVGEDLASRGAHLEGWQVLRREYVFNLVGFGGITGSITQGSNVVTGLSSTAGIVAGMIATANGLPWYPTVLAVDAVNGAVTLDAPAEATITNAQLSFGQESYPIPSDCDHFIAQTGWDRSFRWQLVGPLSAQEWQVLKSGISPAGPRLRWRIMDGKIFVNPVPASADKLVMEYYSNGWCQSISGTPQTTWAADSDTPLIQDRLFILGIMSRFLNRKGLDSSVADQEYERAISIAIARTAGARSLPINAVSRSDIGLISSSQVPDTGFGA